jgi:hypothetical protein
MDKEEISYEDYPLSQEAAEKLYSEFAERDEDAREDQLVLEKHQFYTEVIGRSEMLGAVFIELSRGIVIIRWVEDINQWRWEIGEMWENSNTFADALDGVCHYIHKRNKDMKKYMWISAWRGETSGK